MSEARSIEDLKGELERISRDSEPDRWFDLKNEIGWALFRARGDCAEQAREAGMAFLEVLAICPPERHLGAWVSATLGMVDVWIHWYRLDPDDTKSFALPVGVQTYLVRAEGACKSLLEKVTRDWDANAWAHVQARLGDIYLRMGDRAGGSNAAMAMAHWAHATTAFRAALDVFTRDAYPYEWAHTRGLLGEVFHGIGFAAKRRAAVLEAIKAYQESLECMRAARPEYSNSAMERLLADARSWLGRNPS